MPAFPRFLRPLLLSSMVFAVAGCFNENEEQVLSLGNVSLGQQLIDLKEALDTGAISKREYRELRQALMTLIRDGADAARADDDDDDDDEYGQADKDDENSSAAQEEDDGFNWF